MKLLYLLVIVPLALVSSSPGQDDRRAVKEFEKAFASSPRRPRTLEDRRAALRTLDQHDSEPVAEALVDAYLDLSREIDAIVVERAAIQVEIAELLEGQESVARRVLPKEKFDRYHELRPLDERLRTELDGLRALVVEVRARVGSLASKDALDWLVGDALKDRKLDVALKLAIARAAGSTKHLMLPELVAALKRAKDPNQVLALLDGLALGGPAGREAAPQIVARLEDPDGRVRERAALALAKLAAAEGIEPMIDLLQRERGQAKKSVAAALEILTGQQHGTSVGAWRAWFAAEGAAYLAGEHELGKGRPSRRSAGERDYYFDIPQDGKSTVYVIDASGSMEKEIELKTQGTTAGGKTTSRLEACKAELIRALGQLSSEVHFNVIWYSDLPYKLGRGMQKATKNGVAAAQARVLELAPAGSTNIHDALQMAFALTGQGAKDRYYDIEVDTIFLLTDGSPTKPDGSSDSTEAILAAVREWNPLKRVTIHTIGLGGELNVSFLQQLARENGGEFKQH